MESLGLDKPLKLWTPPKRCPVAAFKNYRLMDDHAVEQVNALKNVFRRARCTPEEKAQIGHYLDHLENIVKYPYTAVANAGSTRIH